MPPIIRAAAFAGLACLAAPAESSSPESMHPDFELKAVPLPGKYKTMGLGFLSDGRMVLATSEFIGLGEVPAAPGEEQKVLVVSDPGGPRPTVREIANFWLQPVGITIADDTVYVSDRDGFYRIDDLGTPADLHKNRTKMAAWPDTSDWSFGTSWHQFVFTPVHWRGHFYAPYSGSIGPGGYSGVAPSNSFAGAFLKWDRSGRLEKVAGGFRSPNGCNLDPEGEMFVTDNQGSWLPSSTFMLMKPGRFYGHRQSPIRDSAGAIVKVQPPNWAESLPYERPTAWLDHGNVRFSPSQPVYVDKGTYAGDWLLGDVNMGGLVRIGLDQVDSVYNGCVLWFGNGFGSAAINRLAWGKDGALYVGTLMQMGNWPGGEKTPLYRVIPKSPDAPAFDIRLVRSLADGLEIHFTQPVDPRTVLAGRFQASHWGYVRQEGYGMGKTRSEDLAIAKAEVSADAKRVRLVIDSLREDRVVHLKAGAVKSASGAQLWGNEAWLTLNRVSARTWDAEGPTASPRSGRGPAASFRMRAGAAGLELRFDSPGRAEARLFRPDGSLSRSAAGDGVVTLSVRDLPRGLYVLETRQGNRVRTGMAALGH